MADVDGDAGADRRSVEVDECVAGTIGVVAVRVSVGAGGGVLVGLVGMDVDIVLVIGRVVDDRSRGAPGA